MNELLKVEVNENQEQVISGRELHMFLNVNTPYTQWFSRMCEYGFTENVDYVLHSQKCESSNASGFKVITDHIMKIDMAKELCMLARNEKGKQARHYFLEVERDWNSPEKVMARALNIANNTINNLKLENSMQKQMIAEFKPVKEYVDTILSSTDTVTITQIAADYGLSARALNKILWEEHLIHSVNGQWILYKRWMNKGFTKSETINVPRADGSSKVVMNTKWTQKGRLKIHEILTSIGILPEMDRAVSRTESERG